MKYYILFVIFSVISISSFSIAGYKMTLTNGVQIDDYNYEFDILISCEEGILELTSYQCSLNFNNDIVSGEELQFYYKEGTSELKNIPAFTIGVYDNGGYNVLAFAAMVGSDTISSIERRVGRFCLSSSGPFNGTDADISWNFEGNIVTILTGTNFTDITDPSRHYPLSGNVSDAEEIIEPAKFELFQNYPNPFNPATTIKFTIPSESFVEIRIYNSIGEEIKILVYNYLPAGTYAYKFDASALSSGVYFYTLYVNRKLINSKMMVLMK